MSKSATSPKDTTLKKSELIDAVKAELQDQKITKKKIDEIISAIFDAIKAEVQESEDHKCNVNSFGTFTQRERKARQGRHPQHKDQVIEIPASKTVGLKVSKALKDKLKVKPVSGS
jgi:nucleoid DNA-binding protein